MNPLFPVSSRGSLFPVCEDVPDSKATNSHEAKLDWLENKSFPSIRSLTPTESNVQSSQERKEHILSKRKASESSEETVSEEMETKDMLKSKKRKKKKKHKHKKTKKKNYVTEVSRTPSPVGAKPKLSETQRNKVFIEELPFLEPEDAFRIDRKSNIYNWKYESLYKGHIAAFTQTFKSGLGGKGGPQPKENKQKSKDKTNRYFSRENRKVSSQAPLSHFLPSRENHVFQSDVIPVSAEVAEHSRHEKCDQDVREQLMDKSTSHYIKGEGVEIVDKNVSLTETEYRLNKKTAEFNRRTREEPHNTDLWLQFVEFQDSLLRFPESEGHFKISKAAVQEKKIAIMKKAMEANQGNIILKLKYLQLCQGTMESDQVNKEMEDLIFHNPANVALWKQYLLFNQSRLASFSVSRMCKLYQKCITTLVKYQEGRLKTHTLPVNLSHDLVGIFVDLCTFLKQAGHKEKAMAAFQALIELNLCCPERLRSAQLSDKIIILESFWDSGVQRFGEEGAKGWSFWMDNKESLPAESESSGKEPSLDDEEQTILERGSEKWETWLQIETLRESAHWLPWKPDLSAGETMDDCEDVDKLVLFDDISQFLFCLPEELSLKLLYEFLNFLGFENCQLDECVQDTERLCHIFNSFGIEDFKKPCPVTEQRFLHKFIGNVIQQGLLKFQGVFKTDITALWLRYQTTNEVSEKTDVKKFKKTARNVLKDSQNRSKKSVWMEYCNLLTGLGDQNGATEVLEMAIPMLCVNTDEGKEYVPAFYRTLVEILLKFPFDTNVFQFSKNTISISSESVSRSIHVLICLCESRHSDLKNPESTSSVTRLKSRRKMEELLNSLLQDYKEESGRSREDYGYLLDTTRCCALYEYAFSDLNLDNALCVLNKVQSFLFNLSISNKDDSNCSVNQKLDHCLEQIFRYKIKVIHHHMSVHHSSLSPLRTTVEAALEVFPDHVYFLTVFLEIERGCMVFGRLDRFYGHHIGRVKSPDLTVFAVASLIQRQKHRMAIISDESDKSLTQFGSGVIHKIRSYLERSLELPELQHCSVLWSLYSYCEAKFGQSERASGLYYRSLQQCPWVKSLYMDGVKIFQNTKLEEITDLMLEKEIRLQIPLEEIDILQS